MEMPDAQIRYKILQAVYHGAKERNSDTYRFMPDHLGFTYAETNYQLRYMKSKGLISYTPRMLMRTYAVTLLPSGKDIVDNFESAFYSQNPDRDDKMKEALAPLK